ncbi:hypothetical protein [Polluticoccus soli]|uniref:hypothetical protein n=1 Tax=Polluticoccus soli TaxID=3034150 RepID=UPI0023E26FFB|nr:hypothetical protein [Flavipsychrobacter sp. JY13-12]
MRTILSTICLFIVSTATAHDFKLSLRGSGFYVSGKPRSDIYSSTVTGTLYNFPAIKTIGYSGALQFRHGGEWIEMAYGIETGSLTSKNGDYSYSSSTDPNNIQTLFVSQNIADIFYSTHVMANVKIPIGKLHPYAGIMTGLVRTEASGKAVVNTYSWAQSFIEFESFDTYGATLGAQAGINYPVIKHLELAGELGIRRTWLHETAVSFLDDRPKLNYRLLTLNVSVGVNYVF